MTAIAPAPAHPPNVASPAHPSRQGASDPFAFAAVLDSLPHAETKRAPVAPVDKAQTPDKHGETQAQPDLRSALVDSALISALPFAPLSASPAAIVPGETHAGTVGATPVAAAPKKTPEVDDSGAPHGVSLGRANGAAGARLVSERTFLLSASYGGGAIAAPLKHGTPANPPARVATAPAADPAGGVQKSGAQALPPSAPAPKPVERAAEPGERASGGQQARPFDAPTAGASGAEVVTPGSQLDSGQTATFVLPGPSRLEPANSTASAASAAPRADANATSPAPAASPVKEIDLDLSPGGLENVSMTMRLAGDRLSVVIRASSSQTLGAIEGARDAIAERMAAIGQPLSAIIIQQTDATADGTKNPNAASGEDRPGTDERHSGQRTGSRDDQSAHRRGFAGDLGF